MCGGKTRSVGMATPTPAEENYGAGRVENYLCDKCNQHTRFPRYNHPGTLNRHLNCVWPLTITNALVWFRIVTARKRSCGNVVFLHVSVCPQGEGASRMHLPQMDLPTSGCTPPPPPPVDAPPPPPVCTPTSGWHHAAPNQWMHPSSQKIHGQQAGGTLKCILVLIFF